MSPNWMKWVSMRLYHALGAGRSPYSALWSRYTQSSFPLITNPSGYETNTSSLSSPLRKADLTSSWYTIHSFWAVMDRKILIVSIRATGANISSKSILFRCEYPLVTMQGFLLSKVPSGLSFDLNTHFKPISFFPSGSETKLHVWFLLIALISSFVAAIHSWLVAASS